MDIVERLRIADPISTQRLMGSAILGEAADEIERLRADRDLMMNLLDFGQSGYISGSSYDLKWNKQKEEVLTRIRSNEQSGAPKCVMCGEPAVGTCSKTEGWHRT